MFKSFYRLLFSLFLAIGFSNLNAQTISASCDCQLDTLGLSNYINSLAIVNEEESLSFSVESNAAKFAVLQGTIDASTPSITDNFINSYPNVTTLVFLSIPGSADDEANLTAARKLRKEGFISYLPAVDAYDSDAYIASGGVDLFLSGTTRIVDEGAEIGVHSWADGNGNVATDYPVGDPAHQPYIEYYTEMGFTPSDAAAFYYFTINAASAEDIYYLTDAEIEQYKLSTCKRPDNCDSDGGTTDGGTTDGGTTDGGTTEETGTAKAKWTYLIYLNGSDLESGSDAGTSDLAEMTSAGNTDNINVIVTTGGANKPGWKELKRWKIENGQQVPISFTAADNNMANTQNLTDFINWAITNYPAEKYVLDLWNHGMDIRGYGHDEVTDKEIRIPALRAAIANADFIKAGNRFEILGFDACLMATIEVQSSLQNFGNYFVASEELEPGHGWNYKPIVEAMSNQSATNGLELGKVIADGFLAQARTENQKNVTLSVVNLAQVNPVITALEDLTNTIRGGGSGLIQKVQRARAKAESYSVSVEDPVQSEDMVDIGDLMKKLKVTAPELSNQIDAVLNALNQAVLYNIKDETRPNATGIAIYWPHDKLVDRASVASSFTEYLDPIAFSPTIKSFLKNDYVANVQADERAPEGDFFDYGDGGAVRGTTSGSRSAGRWSAIKIPDSDDLEQVQVVLSSPSILAEEMAGDVLLLGATLPDVEEEAADGSGLVFAYEWDGLWLGINGYPAYIADIYEYEIESEAANDRYFTRVKVLGVLNPDADGFGQDIIMSFGREGDDADFVLESIVPESYGENVMLTAKERIKLKPGDQVQLLYEGFNNITNEDFYAIDDDAIFTIETGNEDLVLDYDELDYGEYALGFQLLDLSQNDTILFDPNPFLLSTSIAETFANNNITMYPNPADQTINIAYPDFGGSNYELQVTSLSGQILSAQEVNSANVEVSISTLPSGFYLVRIITANKIYSDKLTIQR